MYDAIIVGARCAGSTLGLLLARRGYRVLLVDHDTFPSGMPISCGGVKANAFVDDSYTPVVQLDQYPVLVCSSPLTDQPCITLGRLHRYLQG